MISKSTEETKKIAENLAQEILRSKKKRDSAFILALKGDLGGGKTTFLQGFARGLLIKEKITSPTFNIFKKYRIKMSLAYFYHFDCYRIEEPKEILDLGFEEIIKNPKNIVAIEWAERIKGIIPKNTKWINFDFIDENARNIDIF